MAACDAGKVGRGHRTEEDGTERTGFVGYIASAVPDGKGFLQVKTNAPEGLLLDRPLPFPPPMVDYGTSPDALMTP